MQNAEIARCFDEYADLLEIDGANPFRVRAYRNASRTIEAHTSSIADLVGETPEKLDDLPGIGKDLAEKIVSIVETGQFPALTDIRVKIPLGVHEMLKLPGIGPKKVAALFHELGLTTLEMLKTAAEAGKIAELKGFGKKTEQAILEGMTQIESAGKRFLLMDAKVAADEILHDLMQLKEVERGEVAGSCRRLKETVGDLDLLVTSHDAEAVMDRLAQHRLVEKILVRGPTKQRVRLKMGIEMDLRVVPDESYGAALQYFTGSKEHNIVIRRRAQERGLKVNEYGVFRDDAMICGKHEADVYSAVDLPWIPPELRENRGEIDRAEKGTLPKLIEVADLKGDLHMHTTATDGAATILEMIEGAKAKGYQYIAITDHSQRVSMANGLNAERLRAHWKEIVKVREKVSGIEVLCGIECDILEDATMDLADDVLREADWVIAVLHYGLKQPAEKIHERLMNAIRCPYVNIIGHPTGRLLGKRPGASVKFDEVFRAAKDHGVMMEINAHPSRLDLDDIQAAAARDVGIPIVINTDAHSVQGLDMMPWGIFQARRAGLEAKDVANTKPWAQFKKLLKR
ncbi:MAG: DNA polymerase/3'-5' exonuclease PolX [Planctomycetaceae bacterium]